MKEKSKEMHSVQSILCPLTREQEEIDRLDIIHSVFTNVYAHRVRKP